MITFDSHSFPLQQGLGCPHFSDGETAAQSAYPPCPEPTALAGRTSLDTTAEQSFFVFLKSLGCGFLFLWSLNEHGDPERFSSLPEVTQLVKWGDGTQMQVDLSPTRTLFRRFHTSFLSSLD